MNRNIIILTDAFDKPAYVPRLRSLGDYLLDKGWHVEVYTEKYAPLNFEHSYPIYEIPVYHHKKGEWAIKALWSLLTDWKSHYFARMLKRLTQNKEYALVFCTTFAYFPMLAAYELAHDRNIPLHVDIRDLAEQSPEYQYFVHKQWWNRFFQKVYLKTTIRRRNTVIQKANQITTISPWHVDFIKHINPNTFLIYNGFDEKHFYPKDIVSDTFLICYTGRIYQSSIQDPTLLMQALQTLSEKYKIKVAWYTDDAGKDKIQRLAQQYGVESYMEYHAYVPIQRICSVLHQSSILLVLSNTMSNGGPKGIMTTKFFEALGVEKPVLCVRSDEGCLSYVINQTNAGIATNTVQQVQSFIMEKYKEWEQKGFTRQKVELEQKKAFSRQSESQCFEQLFLRLL